jgi:hypothetical protein
VRSPQGISTAEGGRRVVAVAAAAGAAVGVARGSGIEVVVAAVQLDAAEIVLVGVEEIRFGASWSAGASRALVGLLLRLAVACQGAAGARGAGALPQLGRLD